MTHHIAYYDYEQGTPTTCDKCGWSGPMPEPNDWFRELFDVYCPACREMLAIVAYPTVEETKAAAAAGNEAAQRELGHVARMEARWARAREINLARPDQLPDLEGEELRLDWGYEEADGEHWTLLRHGDRLVYRELAFYEGYARFEEIVGILRMRYGDRLKDVEPTRASLTYLYGDLASAPERVGAARNRLAEG